MIEIDASETERTAGGGWFGLAQKAVGALYGGINAGGATLRNYYGEEATLELFSAGNLGA